MNPFLHSSADVIRNDYSRKLEEATTTQTPYVKRIEIEGNDFHRVKSDKEVLVTQYYSSSQNLMPYEWSGGGNDCRGCHYNTNASYFAETSGNMRSVGDPEFVPIIPKRAYSIDTKIPVTLAGGNYLDQYFPQDDPYQDWTTKPLEEQMYRANQGPLHFITLVIAKDEDRMQSDLNFAWAYDYPTIGSVGCPFSRPIHGAMSPPTAATFESCVTQDPGSIQLGPMNGSGSEATGTAGGLTRTPVGRKSSQEECRSVTRLSRSRSMCVMTASAISSSRIPTTSR